MPPIVLKLKGGQKLHPFADFDNEDDLSKTWRVCTKVKDSLEDGSRLENLSWRLWHYQLAAGARAQKKTTPSSVEQLASMEVDDTTSITSSTRQPDASTLLNNSDSPTSTLRTLSKNATRVLDGKGNADQQRFEQELKKFNTPSAPQDMLSTPMLTSPSLAQQNELSEISKNASSPHKTMAATNTANRVDLLPHPTRPETVQTLPLCANRAITTTTNTMFPAPSFVYPPYQAYTNGNDLTSLAGAAATIFPQLIDMPNFNNNTISADNPSNGISETGAGVLLNGMYGSFPTTNYIGDLSHPPTIDVPLGQTLNANRMNVAAAAAAAAAAWSTASTPSENRERLGNGYFDALMGNANHHWPSNAQSIVNSSSSHIAYGNAASSVSTPSSKTNTVTEPQSLTQLPPPPPSSSLLHQYTSLTQSFNKHPATQNFSPNTAITTTTSADAVMGPASLTLTNHSLSNLSSSTLSTNHPTTPQSRSTSVPMTMDLSSPVSPLDTPMLGQMTLQSPPHDAIQNTKLSMSTDNSITSGPASDTGLHSLSLSDKKISFYPTAPSSDSADDLVDSPTPANQKVVLPLSASTEEDTESMFCRNCGVTSTPLWRRSVGELLCNACGLYLKLHNMARPKVLKPQRKEAKEVGTPSTTSVNHSKVLCSNCGTTNTPLWRRDELGAVLCNACGLYLKLHHERRPLSLKTDVIKKRQRFDASTKQKKQKTTDATAASEVDANDSTSPKPKPKPKRQQPNRPSADPSLATSSSPNVSSTSTATTTTVTTTASMDNGNQLLIPVPIKQEQDIGMSFDTSDTKISTTVTTNSSILAAVPTLMSGSGPYSLSWPVGSVQQPH